MRLANKVALITGAGSGIGRETALLFAKEGAKVVVADIQIDAGEETVSLIETEGGNASFCQVDVSKASDVEQMIEFAEKSYGKLNVLLNNAGIFHPKDVSVLEIDEEIWDTVLNVNLKGVLFGCKYGIPALLRAGGGSIVNTASFVALIGAAVSQIAYTASKGGVLAMTRDMAIEFARQNIRVNALCPGSVETPLLADLLDDVEWRERRFAHIPMGRFGKVKEVALAALFLASDESSYVTGTTFTVDGGITSAYITAE